MTAAFNLEDLKEAQAHHERAKIVYRIFVGTECPRCGSAQDSGKVCGPCLQIAAIEDGMARNVVRNAGHECVDCDGAGFTAGFFAPIACEACGASGDARMRKAPWLIATMLVATRWAGGEACLQGVDEILSSVPEADDWCQEWPEGFDT